VATTEYVRRWRRSRGNGFRIDVIKARVVHARGIRGRCVVARLGLIVFVPSENQNLALGSDGKKGGMYGEDSRVSGINSNEAIKVFA
jgi:hypothetical protein